MSANPPRDPAASAASGPAALPPGGERGSILVVSLLMLVVFTVIGATFLTLANTEGRIATNVRSDVQALFVAESGAHMAYQELAANNFQGWTHQPDGSPEALSPLIPVTFAGDLVLDGPGTDGLRDERDDYAMVWEWAPGDPGQGLTRTGQLESIRFSAYPATANVTNTEFTIDVEGTLGPAHQRIQVRGIVEPAFTYAIFADGHLSEFTRGEDQDVNGKIHANGDLFFRPWNPRTLSIDSPSVTATGRMIRTTDIFGRDLFSGSTVRIKDRSGNWVTMALGTPGNAMDSMHPNWANEEPGDGIDGALELWEGIVRDGQLGATRVDPPPVATITPGGWYDQRASFRLAAGDVQTDAAGNDISALVGPAVREVTFWNPAIGEYNTVQEIDMAALAAGGNFPPNGLIYSDAPLRIVNADALAGPLTIVSSQSIYTKGHFNSVNKRPAAIISRNRIWHLSNAWSDADSKTKGSISGRQAANGTTTINAALVDGQPPIGTAQCADLDGDGNPDDPGAGNAIENADHLLEAWGGSRTLRKLGSIVHLQNADMADNLRNTGRRPEEEPWIRFGAYDPPERDYAYDPSFSGNAGQPPFTILVGRIYLWQQINL